MEIIANSLTEVMVRFEAVEVRGVAHRGYAHLVLGPEIFFAKDQQGNEFFSARDARGMLGPVATPAAAKKLRSLIVEAVGQWREANPGALVEAERERLREAMAEASGARDQAAQAYAQAQQAAETAHIAWVTFDRAHHEKILP